MNGNGIVIILLCLAAIIVLLTEILNILIKQFPDNSVCKKIWVLVLMVKFYLPLLR